MLVGERPGLVTDKSMSAYITYRPRTGVSESARTVVSNIHAQGTPAVEAGAHIAGLIETILTKKGLRRGTASGGGGMIPVKVLAVRYLANAAPALCRQLGAPEGYPSLGLLTTDCDDATYIALDAATKAAQVQVAYAPAAFTPGRPTPPRPLPGRSSAFWRRRPPARCEAAWRRRWQSWNGWALRTRRGAVPRPHGQQRGGRFWQRKRACAQARRWPI